MPAKVIIVGAGWFGVVTAKTYLQVDPTIDLTILESEETIGGTWSQGRIYPNLLAQQPFGSFEFADKRMPSEGFTSNDFIPASTIHSYISDYAKEFSVFERIRFSTTVSKISRAEDGVRWNVWTQGSTEPMVCDKLIIATGLTSNPVLPDIPTAEFTPPVFHTKDLGSRQEFITSPTVNTVTVYGGGKSSIDCVHLCVKSGKKVNWVIRTSHNGVATFIPGIFWGRNSNFIVSTRFGLAQQPSQYAHEGWWYRFMHSGQNTFGHWMHWSFWGWVSAQMLATAGYSKSDNMKKLKPELESHAPFWLNVPPAIITQPEILDWIHKGTNIKVYRQAITSLSGNNVHLDNGEALTTDALIYATGYDIRPEVFSTADAAKLGVPTPVGEYPSDLKEKWDALEADADKEVTRLFPRLAQPPSSVKWTSVPYTPYRLYRSIVPLPLLQKKSPDRSLVFVGAVGAANTGIISEAVALWSVAWLTGNLDVTLGDEELDKTIAFQTVFSKRRYLNAGAKYPYIVYEYLATVDSMLKELGVNPIRKSGSLKDFLTPYAPKDYSGLVEEWKKTRGLASQAAA